jgi:hypothetical protein
MPRAKKSRKKKPSQKKQILGSAKKKAKGSLSGTCPIGSHWVRTHPMTVPPSKKNPEGMTTRRAHCARNPASSKVSFSPQDLKKIASTNTFKSQKKPCALRPKKGESSEFDDLIAGWTQYWNEVFKSDPPLDPNLVKALVKSESTFNPLSLADPKNPASARGLTQITDDTRIILGNRKGELKDYHLDLTREDLNDPSNNICTGIRWLYYKRERASAKLGKQASWEEGVAEYKSLTRKLKAKTKSIRDRAQELFDRFKRYYKQYKSCKK